jgi:hypothetical protein
MVNKLLSDSDPSASLPRLFAAAEAGDCLSDSSESLSGNSVSLPASRSSLVEGGKLLSKVPILT